MSLRRILLAPLRAADSAGGFVLGAVAGLAIVWVVGAAALVLPGQKELRRQARESEVLERLNRIVAPSTLIDALARVDPFPSRIGPAAPAEPPTEAVLREPRIRAAAPSVVRVLGTACGVGISGSGWVAAPHLVVTAAHVVAGERRTWVQQAGSSDRLRAVAVGYDPRNDLAVLRVPELDARPLPLSAPREGAAAAIVGYPENGPLDSTPARVGSTERVLADDAYGRGPISRTVTSLGGDVRHGHSGAPVIDAAGKVEATVFASRREGEGGFGVPSELVRNVVAAAHGRVSTGACAP
jgi:S1-C subfamily serine protease